MGTTVYSIELLVKRVVCFLLRDIVRYRRNVVIANLRKAFPSSSLSDMHKMESAFYRNLADILVESAMSLFISRSFLLSRVKVINPDLLRELHEKKTSTFFLGGHIGNWEWGGMATGNFSPMHNVAVYLPLKSKWVDKLMQKVRRRLTLVDALIPSSRLYRYLASSHIPFQVYVLSDQSPPKNNFIRVPFFNMPTAFFSGTPRMIQKLGTAAVYLETRRIRSGYYEVRLFLLHDSGASVSEEAILKSYAASLESSIMKSPSDWLWSHRRWKF
jgi:KDO2-lipid IV(A) lauroyltransferase